MTETLTCNGVYVGVSQTDSIISMKVTMVFVLVSCWVSGLGSSLKSLLGRWTLENCSPDFDTRVRVVS